MLARLLALSIARSAALLFIILSLNYLIPQDPANILSSAAVDPNLIPLPPLPPINLPTTNVDLPFADLGLNSWWPPGWVQWALEYGHTDWGTYTMSE